MPSPARKKRPEPRRSPIQGRAQHTVEAILKAAAQILERHGSDAATTNAIAGRAGVSIGSLYQYFADRDALIDGSSAATSRPYRPCSARPSPASAPARCPRPSPSWSPPSSPPTASPRANREGVWHLSALMCPQHRSDTIAGIKNAFDARREALARGELSYPVRVVSTQLVEAGVDLDFPVVFRAMAGLDSIAQAAGRCNREGRLEQGHVHEFVPPTPPPPGLLRQARSTCRTIWHGVAGDPLDLQLFPRYFSRLHADGNLDKHGICDMLRVGREADVRFRDAADKFRLIDNEDAGTVIVRYPVGDSPDVDQWIAMLEGDGPLRWLMRKLQRYGVTIYQHDIRRLLTQGDIREFGGCPGLYVQVSDLFYDPIRGVNVEGAPGDPAQLTV